MIKAKTWPRDSHGLFDYESHKTARSRHSITAPAAILRTNDHVTYSQDVSLWSHSNCLAYVQLLSGCTYQVTPARPPLERQSEKMWYIVGRNQPSSLGYRLCVGDVLKLGRTKFRVKQLHTADGGSSLKELLRFDESDDSEVEGETVPCRVCLRESQSSVNPLVSPCRCAGTMKYIHLKCLQRALRAKITTRSTESSVSFEWVGLACDLCRQPIPPKLSVAGKVVDLLEVKPNGNFLVLETLRSDRTASKGLHLLSFPQTSVRLGRGNDCELKISSISVSRIHAKISLHEGCFYLDDLGSKFGTLVQVKRPLAIEQSLSLQIGRSTFSFRVKKPWLAWLGCCRGGHSADFEWLDCGNAPVLPVNTGIPLSVADPEALMTKAGLTFAETNLMRSSYQLGLNSSCDEELLEVGEAELYADFK